MTQTKINLKNECKEYKFRLGDQVRRKFDKIWYMGTIYDRGVYGGVNTYKVSYSDTDLLVLAEGKVEIYIISRQKIIPLEKIVPFCAENVKRLK